ncbi:murein biosynthesis integral membrane protein MurJ [Hyalangium minutum]|uniref:Probable lipid II flippase MurJ n=1 Tax=Hyalangium minutum TaxID=394096 RepID=A0A085WRJ8_9BACT|nr:murein biosynthesis integral membrane protein MurJ [Hyalangium minutum]KFE70311.1 putative peptidoglycan lipid II flippase MurJ [Hyalangium minutum]
MPGQNLPPPPEVPAKKSEPGSGRGALFVAAGILASRLMGLVRERVFAHYLGNAEAAAVFKAALRIPNFLQNLFGEGVLSGSFIPVYAQLLGQKNQEEADRLAGAIFGLMALATSLFVAAGMLATPLFVDAIAPGFEGESRALAIQLVRIVFPGTGLLVLSAWCLGILNSHRRFLLSYLAPVVWNLVLIGTLVVMGGRVGEERLAELLAYAVVAGSFLQFAVQVPSVMRLLGKFRPSLSVASESVRRVLRSFVPVVIGRGVVQISAYVDTAVASLLSERALSSLFYAQTIYLIPVSLFGMAVSAAELPEMSRATGGATEEVNAKLRERIEAGARRVAFFVVPSATAFLLLGDVVAATLLQTGRFTPADSRYVWYLLMGSAVGLVSATVGRLYSSAFYALKDPSTPLRFAIVRVGLGALMAWGLGLYLPEWLGLPRHLGAAFITVASGLVAWVEAFLLRRSLARRIGGHVGPPPGLLPKLWGAAAVAGVVALGVKAALTSLRGPMLGVAEEWGGSLLAPPALPSVVTFLAVVAPYGIIYFALTAAMGLPQAQAVFRRARRLLGR